jgi:YafQ family addiction module toxin component
MFEYDITEEFEKIICKIVKKNPILAETIHRKIKEIISRDKDSITSYKNLKYDLKDFKRIHITGQVIMFFKVNINENKILFVTLKHRDDAYK